MTMNGNKDDNLPAYDPANVFATIMRGELPAQRVYEDEATLAIMDIMPRTDGHVLVIPKAPCRNVFDAPPEALQAVALTVQKVARAVKTAFAADGVTIQQFNERAGGQLVFHLHVHVLPRHDGVSLRPHTGEMAPSEALAAHAQKIRRALAQG
jgi:histidine triad (HIT) family protein